MNQFVDTLINQTAKANPSTETVYSLILLILIAVSALLFYLYRSERKENTEWAAKSMKAAELLATIHLRLEDQRKDSDRIEEFNHKIDTLIDNVAKLQELRDLLIAIRESVNR
jgi:hypothetical protein